MFVSICGNSSDCQSGELTLVEQGATVAVGTGVDVSILAAAGSAGVTGAVVGGDRSAAGAATVTGSVW